MLAKAGIHRLSYVSDVLDTRIDGYDEISGIPSFDEPVSIRDSYPHQLAIAASVASTTYGLSK